MVPFRDYLALSRQLGFGAYPEIKLGAATNKARKRLKQHQQDNNDNSYDSNSNDNDNDDNSSNSDNNNSNNYTALLDSNDNSRGAPTC